MANNGYISIDETVARLDDAFFGFQKYAVTLGWLTFAAGVPLNYLAYFPFGNAVDPTGASAILAALAQTGGLLLLTTLDVDMNIILSLRPEAGDKAGI